MCEEVEEFYKAKETRKFHQNTNSIRKGFKPNARINEENIIEETVDILEKSAHKLEEVLNPYYVHIENHIHPSEDFEESVEMDIDEMDIELAIAELKNFKAPRTDGLPAELYKYGGHILNKYIYNLISETWTKEETPADWKVGLICPIYTKDHLL
jgi:hypothetical protein